MHILQDINTGQTTSDTFLNHKGAADHRLKTRFFFIRKSFFHVNQDEYPINEDSLSSGFKDDIAEVNRLV